MPTICVVLVPFFHLRFCASVLHLALSLVTTQDAVVLEASNILSQMRWLDVLDDRDDAGGE